jgi:predicted aminopeptidase
MYSEVGCVSPNSMEKSNGLTAGGILLAAVLVLMVLCSGCRIAYIMHAAAGQFRLMHRSVPVEEAFRGDSLTAVQKEHLRLVARVKEFGEKELGLKETENYESVYLESPESPLYVVSASPKDRLALITWWFPVVGDVPYLGFFDLENAKSEKEKLLAKDLDVTLGMAEAYSTLGWFRDPVTMNLLQGSTVDLVETILHEMTHTTMYYRGQGDFNEGLAILVGKMGAYQFLEKNYGPEHPLCREARESIEDERLFSAYLRNLLQELAGLYDSQLEYTEKLARRERVFSDALESFEELRDRLQTGRFTRFGSGGLNNAYLMSVGLYHRNFHIFEAIFRENADSVRQTLAFIRDLGAEDKENLMSSLRNGLIRNAGNP